MIVDEVNHNEDLLNYSKIDVNCNGQDKKQQVIEQMKEKYDEKLGDFETKLKIESLAKFGSNAENASEIQKQLRLIIETTLTHNTPEVKNKIKPYLDKIDELIDEIYNQTNK